MKNPRESVYILSLKIDDNEKSTREIADAKLAGHLNVIMKNTLFFCEKLFN